MLIIDHRRNSPDLLAATPVTLGCEIDIRNHGQELIVTHDAFVTEGARFEEWLQNYRHAFLIVNVKEEGLEERIFAALQARGISNFFILDESFPFIRRWALKGRTEFALRVSEYESAETALAAAKAGIKIEWIWADCFSGKPMDKGVFGQLKAAGYKVCFVSPELHFVDEPGSWERRAREFIADLHREDMVPDAVCTKLPERWKDFT